MEFEEKSKSDAFENLENHKLTVKLDSGDYRHLVVAAPGTNIDRFEIMTFPGGLMCTGDMGSYVFERVPAMSKLVVDHKLDDIDLYFWSKKLVSIDKTVGYLRFNSIKFQAEVDDEINEFVSFVEETTREKCEDKEKEAFRSEISRLVSDVGNEFEMYQAYETINSNEVMLQGLPFSVEMPSFSDFLTYNYGFIFCCCAITLAINKYKDSLAEHDIAV